MKLTKTQKNWLIAGGIIVGLILISRAQKKKGKKTSNFLGSPFGKRVAFTLNNPGNKSEIVPLFNSYTNVQNPKVGINPSIAEFNRTLLNEPKKIKAIEVRVNSAKNANAQSQEPVVKTCKDASGEESRHEFYPQVSAYQAQPGMTVITPENLILDGTCFLNYKMTPKSQVVIMIHYDVVQPPKKSTKR